MPRSSLDTPNPSIAPKVALHNDFEILDLAPEEEYHTPQAITLIPRIHTPPLTPPHPYRTPAMQSLIPPDTLAQIKHFLDRETCSDTSLHLHGITDAMLQELDVMEEAGKLGGGKVRCVANLQCPILPV